VHEVADGQDTDLISPPGRATFGDFWMVHVGPAAAAAPVGAIPSTAASAATARTADVRAAAAPNRPRITPPWPLTVLGRPAGWTRRLRAINITDESYMA
jgi:hypothetical protein